APTTLPSAPSLTTQKQVTSTEATPAPRLQTFAPSPTRTVHSISTECINIEPPRPPPTEAKSIGTNKACVGVQIKMEPGSRTQKPDGMLEEPTHSVFRNTRIKESVACQTGSEASLECKNEKTIEIKPRDSFLPMRNQDRSNKVSEGTQPDGHGLNQRDKMIDARSPIRPKTQERRSAGSNQEQAKLGAKSRENVSTETPSQKSEAAVQCQEKEQQQEVKTSQEIRAALRQDPQSRPAPVPRRPRGREGECLTLRDAPPAPPPSSTGAAHWKDSSFSFPEVASTDWPPWPPKDKEPGAAAKAPVKVSTRLPPVG
ncbi:Protein of unknown function, partial [Gryllus bimaculatus]